MSIATCHLTFGFIQGSGCEHATVSTAVYKPQLEFVRRNWRIWQFRAGSPVRWMPLADRVVVGSDGCTLALERVALRFEPGEWRAAWTALGLPADERFTGARALELSGTVQRRAAELPRRRGAQKADQGEREQFYAGILTASDDIPFRTRIRGALEQTPARDLPRGVRQRLDDIEAARIPLERRARKQDLVRDLASAIRKATPHPV